MCLANAKFSKWQQQDDANPQPLSKQTLNYLAKLAKWWSCVVSTFLYGAFDCMLSCHICKISHLFWARSSLTFRQLQSVYSLCMKCICDMIITYIQMHHADKYAQYNSIILLVWLNGWVLVYKLSGCGFESHYCQLNFRDRTSFKQGVFWHSIECWFTLKYVTW